MNDLLKLVLNFPTNLGIGIVESKSNVTFDIVEKHPDKPWNWSGLSRNPNVTFDVVEKHPDKPWDWVD